MTKYTYPAPPKTVEETGLTMSFLTNLVAKTMNEGGIMTPAEISEVIKIPKLVVRAVIKEMTHKLMVESQGLESQDIKSDIRYSLTDMGKKTALEAMIMSQYVGPAPVTIEAFDKQVYHQSIKHEELHADDLEKAFSHLVLPEGLMHQLGPASNSARSLLLYGEPGNGKTSIAEAIGGSFKDTIYVPYAITVGNQIIRFFDETLHERAEMAQGSDPVDPRWVAAKRPVVIAGGELTLDMLDLRFEAASRFYEAPMHLKALGGVFVLDDFGRQTVKPQEFLNRWIVPLEKGFDILSLHTGKKFTVPFDQLVVFSSNMMPEQIGDGAALRRIYFKIHVSSPTKDDYMQIFEDACEVEGLEFQRDVVSAFYDKEYAEKRAVTSGAHPGFLLRHIKAASRYLGRPPQVTREMLDLAWRNVSADYLN